MNFRSHNPFTLHLASYLYKNKTVNYIININILLIIWENIKYISIAFNNFAIQISELKRFSISAVGEKCMHSICDVHRTCDIASTIGTNSLLRILSLTIVIIEQIRSTAAFDIGKLSSAKTNLQMFSNFGLPLQFFCS